MSRAFVDTYLQLDRPNAFVDRIGTSASSRSCSMNPRLWASGTAPIPAAEKLVDRHVECLADEIVDRDVKARLRVRIASNRAIELLEKHLDLPRVLADKRRGEHLVDQLDRRRRVFAVVTAVSPPHAFKPSPRRSR